MVAQRDPPTPVTNSPKDSRCAIPLEDSATYSFPPFPIPQSSAVRRATFKSKKSKRNSSGIRSGFTSWGAAAVRDKSTESLQRTEQNRRSFGLAPPKMAIAAGNWIGIRSTCLKMGVTPLKHKHLCDYRLRASHFISLAIDAQSCTSVTNSAQLAIRRHRPIASHPGCRRSTHSVMLQLSNSDKASYLAPPAGPHEEVSPCQVIRSGRPSNTRRP